MKWITAIDLERWADTLDSRNQLSFLVSNLVRASASKIADFRFPTGDSAQIPGYDGRLIAEEAPPYVPGGESVWEFGTDKDYQGKANEDYKKRSASPGDMTPSQTTFVFVTPRSWTSSKRPIENWRKERRAEGIWKDVRVIDAVDLENWLFLNPAVAAQAVRELPSFGLFPKEGARSTFEFWAEYAYRFKPPLTEDVILCGRNKQIELLFQQLAGHPQTHVWQADSPEEAVAFAVAAIRKASDDVRKFLEARAMVVDSKSAARLLSGRKNMIFFPREEASEFAGPLANGNICLVGIGKESRGQAVVLERPTSYDLAGALKTMGFDENKASQLARSCGRSVTILSRLIHSATARKPVWAGNQKLIPALFAGSWDGSKAEDREILRALSGATTYEEYEDQIRSFLTAQDAPLEIEGQVWNVRAPVDAFGWLISSIGKQDVARLEQVFATVFSEHDPALDLSARERPYAGLSGKKLKQTHWLRDGLATTLLLIAYHGDSGLTALTDPQAFVDNMVANLPGLKEDFRLLTSLQSELPVLMEAAPRPLFKALEHLLEGDAGVARQVFSDVDPMFSHSPHTGLLWALELAAWNPEHLIRVSLILAKLAALDPGGKLSNRPINSLSEIFVPWHPNTNATLTERLVALDEVVNKEPEIGWQLVLGLLPGSHDISHTTMKPRYREAGNAEQEVLTKGLVWETYRELIKRALKLVGSNIERWVVLIKKLDRFDAVGREAAIKQLEKLADKIDEPERVKVWSSLRDLVNRHKAFQGAPWTMAEDAIGKLEKVLVRYEPKDQLAKVAWLFEDYHPRLPDPETRADYEAVDTARERAAQDIYATSGLDGLISLACEVKLPRFLAFAISNVVENPLQADTLIDATIGKSDALTDFAVILSAQALSKFKTAWIERILIRASDGNASVEQVAKLLFAWPDEPTTWDLALKLGSNVDVAYWLEKPVRPVSENDKGALEYTVRKYLNVRRGLAALDVISWAIETVSSGLIIEVLDSAALDLNSPDKMPPNMLEFEIDRVFTALGQRTDLPALEIAKREYSYLPILETRLIENTSRPLVLHRILAEDPASFVMILCDVFREASGERREPTDEAKRRARVGYRLLDSFRTIPGEKEGNINAAVLRKWVNSVRELAKEKDRARIADEFIGHLLAYAPAGTDGFWPHEAVRDLLEELQSEQLEIGINIQRSNMRGVVTKAMYEGGVQERTLAQQARESAKATLKWPRTSNLWRRFAESLEFDAKREDERARQDEMWYE